MLSTPGEAVRWWETRRIAYNAVLTAGVMAWVGLTWPHFRPALNLQALTFLVVAAFGALTTIPLAMGIIRQGSLSPEEQRAA